MSGSITDLFLLAGGDAGYPLRRPKARCMSAADHLSPCSPEEEEEDEEGEETDSFRGVPLRRSCRLRTSFQSHDSFRRHSWEPGKELRSQQDYEERSASLKGLDPDEIENSMGRRQDPRRVPIIHSNEELESFFSLEEEGQAKRLPGARVPSQYFGGASLSKSVSMTGIDHAYSSQEDVSFFAPGRHLANGFGSLSQLDAVESGDKENERREESTLERTLSFIKKKVAGGKAKNKEREKMKEREKEARDKDARYTNGHLFTTITISGMTMCFACNKSITAKEALICPTCNVTIHNRCKDALPSCTKVKQKQQKAALQKNNSALQGVSLRNKTTMIRERPNSAIYPSDSFRQSLLGSRRGRPSLSLSKSVSTTNIAGNLNDDSPLGIRRILSQSTDSLNIRNRTLSVESLIDEGAEVIYNQLMSDFETDEKDFEADSWSLAVDNNYLQQHKKEVMKRQDVIYELIQTEVHHVRTLKIMMSIFRKGMLDDLQMDPALVQNMFPCVDELSEIHVRFLTQLLERRRDSLAAESSKNFVINRLGDILIGQFSGPSAEQMKKAYSEFCSRHNKAMKLYKELFTRDKKFQQFIRRMTRSSILRRHGVQECILLVTQRITKYPVLIDRILQNSKGNEVDQQDLATALTLVKDLISSIDQEVHECEKNLRLQEIQNRMDNRAATLINGNRHFRKEELLRRRLIHDGSLLWKAATGRFKDVLMLLMTDVLIFLQEKDQKYIFPALDKPAVISLQNLIVRDIANQEKGMFLISAMPPEMYEVHTASREDRNTWMKVIQQSVRVCPKREDFPLIETEDEAYLRKLKDEIQQKDREIVELLEEKVSLFAEVTQFQAGEEAFVNSRNLFRADSSDTPRGEKMVNEAIREVEGLKESLLGAGFGLLPAGDRNHPADSESGPAMHPGGTANGETGSINGTVEFCRTDSDLGQKDRNGNQLQQRTPQQEVFQRLLNLYGLLHGLQAVVTQQDTTLELQLQDGGERKEKLLRNNSHEGPLVDVALRSADKQGTELTLLQRQHALLQEELRRCRKQCEEKVQEAAALESRLRESEQARARLEREAEEARRQAAVTAQREQLGANVDGLRSRRVLDPRRRSLPVGDALYLSFTPPQVSQDPPKATFTLQVDDGSGDELSDLTELERLQDGADPEEPSEEENGGQQPSPSSPREFQRMQDIPEESETSHDLRDTDPGSSES
ncbi:rho guanine nucleotide exchange factor 2 isoform X2 [Rhinatrema bivittatum]|uniref:rho guanine nucleotide exchange factor 2 isoform X2 n=1 Tax=Rhinatrema bivittatum TaxID=194408 RepID=UPI00112AE101|nr:rho guanine nucleotide exchange factor 2 isoform X2 [Rhinatrema bivittatum]